MIGVRQHGVCRLTQVGAHETFNVHLSNSLGATILSDGVGTILNDD